MEEANHEENEGIPEPTHTVTIKRRGFTTIEGQEELIEELHQFYISERKAGRTDLMQIFRDFRRSCQYDRKIWFNPYPNKIKQWIAKWEKSLPATMRTVPIRNKDLSSKKERDLTPVKYEDLEDGSKNLQSLLIEDAVQLMEESNSDYQLIDDNGGLWDKEAYEKIRIKKKQQALAVAKEVMAGVHKHEMVKIKKNKEGRETAGFLMDLMRQAQAGELTEESLELLEQGVNNGS